MLLATVTLLGILEIAVFKTPKCVTVSYSISDQVHKEPLENKKNRVMVEYECEHLFQADHVWYWLADLCRSISVSLYIAHHVVLCVMTQ